jgi:hypothetical protein
MEMISQQTIREGFRDGFNILEMQVQEIFVVTLLNKNILTVVSAIVDVIIGIVE